NGQIINALDSLDMGSDGTFWFSQNRFGNPGETVPNVIQFNALGEVLWTSLQISPNGGTDQDPLRGTQGLAFDPVNDVLALATNRAGLIVLLDTNTKTVLEEITFGGGAANVDVAFDAAGNLYVTNRSAERLRVWSPGG